MYFNFLDRDLFRKRWTHCYFIKATRARPKYNLPEGDLDLLLAFHGGPWDPHFAA